MPVHPLHYRPRPIYPDLTPGFYDPVETARFDDLTLRFENTYWAQRVGLDTLTPEEWRAHLGHLEPLPQNLPQTLAMRYHGHQFRSYNPQLGDGRGVLFAQLEDAEDARVLDLATKGSGRTPYSRGGDGRLTLKGGVREILATEMLEALGVYTSKTFSLHETPESLDRHDEPSPTRAALLVRLGHSHLRFGTFQRHAYERHTERMQQLVTHCATHYFPDALHPDPADTALSLFRRITMASSRLASQWLAAGFVHGVLNTDNMNITGESFDYGPWRFIPTLNPDFVAAYFDHQGLYRYGYQASAVRWNLEQLANALSLIAPVDDLWAHLEDFEGLLWRHVRASYLLRLGLMPRDPESDGELVGAVLSFLQDSQMPYQQFFFDWFAGAESSTRAANSPNAAFYDLSEFAGIRQLLRKYTPIDDLDLEHAYFQRDKPCDMLIEHMEATWAPIAKEDDWSALEDKITEIRLMGRALGQADYARAGREE